MASIPVTIVGVLTYTGLEVGGGPIIGGPGGPGGIGPPSIWPSPGYPAHPIAPGGPPPSIWPDPGYPAHPIVIPPDALAPGVPAHPIFLPGYPAHPIVIPPNSIAPGVPAHPIILPPFIPALNRLLLRTRSCRSGRAPWTRSCIYGA